MCYNIHAFTDTDDCVENDCQNGATCVDGINDYTCDCADGFEGEDCGTSKIMYLI